MADDKELIEITKGIERLVGGGQIEGLRVQSVHRVTGTDANGQMRVVVHAGSRSDEVLFT